MMIEAYLGLGANLDNPKQQLISAIDQLSQQADLTLKKVSRFYTSLPMGPADQPDYINAVVLVETALTPNALLALCHRIETEHHRQRLRHWGERTLDIDILCFGNQIISTEHLKIPHIGMAERDFVLLPFADIAPDFIVPTLNRSINDLLKNCPSFGTVPLSE
jgi:2-amino-4-hydroxy-6-hydroxymethyldihydropteridine diphosphokinase